MVSHNPLQGLQPALHNILCGLKPTLQKRTTSPREDSRIAANLDWHLKALMDHLVNGNSAFFSRSEKATFAEILKHDSLSHVSDPKTSKIVGPRARALLDMSAATVLLNDGLACLVGPGFGFR